MTVTFSGAASAGDSGGRNVAFSSFTPSGSPWINLYWGPSSGALPQACLDGTLDNLTFSSIGGSTATWAGTTSWTNPDTGTVHSGVPIRMRVTITAGGLSWVTSTSISDLDPGPGTGIGAVIDDSSVVNFTMNVIFEADIPTDGGTGFIPLNTVRVGAGLARSTFTGAFYGRFFP